MKFFNNQAIARIILSLIWVLFYPVAWYAPVWFSSLVKPEQAFGFGILIALIEFLILILLEILVFWFHAKQNRLKDLIWIFPLGLFAQTLLFSGLFSSRNFANVLLAFSLGFYTLVPVQAAVALLFLVFFFLLRKTKRWWLVSLLTAVTFISGAIALNRYGNWQRLETQSRKNDYDASAVRFRNDIKEQTVLGKLPRPLRILFRDNSWIALDITGKFVSLNLPAQIKPDLSYGIYFDIYTDRVYFVQDKQGFVYDLASDKQTPFRGILAQNLLDRSSFIAGVSGDQIALQTGGGYAGTGDVAIYDIPTGELLSRAVYAGYDESRTYKFWIGTEGYRLILDTNASRRTDVSGDNLVFYLDKIDQPYAPLANDWQSGEQIFDDLGKIPFSHSADSLKGRIPILSISARTSKRNSIDNQSGYFSLRSVYQIGMKGIAMEINDGLAVIDLTNNKAYFTRDSVKIEQLMAEAKLLITDSEDHFSFSCAYTDQIYNLLFKETERWHFAFCLL